LILYFVWRRGLLRRLDREKALFAIGWTREPLALSRRRPLLRAIDWPRAVFSPAYARAVATWLQYRVELYDGLQG
jgi:hypothetical protein